MLGNVIDCFKNGKVFYTFHARKEMEAEGLGAIKEAEVYEAVLNGEIIENYPDDEPYPSCLIFGATERGRPLHIVCAFAADEDTAIVITAYQPDEKLWIDFKRRKR